MNAKDFFIFSFGSIGFDPGNTFAYLVLEDESRWMRIGLGFYWRVSP